MSDLKTILERAVGPFEPREHGLERTRRRLQRRRRSRRLLAGGVGLLVSLVAFVGLWGAFRGAVTPAGRNHERPVPSAERGWIAYTVGAGSSAQIYVTRGSATGTHRLVAGRDPAWSPDGSRIAFRVGAEHQAGARTQIDVASADGTGVKTLASFDGEPGSVGGPTWSPHGRRIAYATFNGIYAMNADGSQVRRLVRYEGQSACYDLEPAWSPDGSKVAFAIRCDGGEGGIWVINTDGSGLRELIGPPPGHLSTARSWSYPAWSPNGAQIAFHYVAPTGSGGGGYVDEVAVMGVSGDHVSTVVPNVDSDSSATWSPDGSSLAFVRQGVVYLVNLDGTGLRRLSPEIGIDVTGSTSWQRVARASPSAHVSTSPTPSAALSQVTRVPAPSPNGLVAAFGSVWAQVGARGSLWRIDPATGHVLARIPATSRSGPLRYMAIGNAGLQPIAAGEGGVWMVVSGGVIEVDPATNRVVAKVEVPADSISVGDGRVWVACCTDPHVQPRLLSEIDPATDRVVRRIPLPSPVSSVAVGEGAVWLVNASSSQQSVLRIDPGTGRIVATIPVRLGAEVVAGDGAVWVSSRAGFGLGGGITEIDPKTNRVVARIPMSGGMGMAVGADRLWINGGSLVELDPVTGKAVTVAHIGQPMDANAGIAYLNGRVWASDPSGQQLVTIRVG